MGKAKRVALYLRVSTIGQTLENQKRELKVAAERHGWIIVAVFSDHGISGTKGRDKRPGFDALCKAISRREFEMVAAWSVDRFGRSLQDLVGFLGEIHGKCIDLYLHQQGLDTSTPAGKAMFHMTGVFAEFERAILVERVNAGLARARAEGKRLGRPTALNTARKRRIQEMLADGVGMIKIGKAVGVGTGTVQKIKAAMAAHAV